VAAASRSEVKEEEHYRPPRRGEAGAVAKPKKIPVKMGVPANI